MSFQLDQLAKTYSQEKNISQRDLFEVALVDFFQRYGYGDAINELLKRGSSSGNTASEHMGRIGT
jgi:hypothetical protein